MIKKIVHISDIHIRTYKYHKEYHELFVKTLKLIKNLIKDFERHEVRIVLAGDIFHQKIVISNEQLMLGNWFLNKLESLAPLVIIAGNHDLLENNKDRIDSITPLITFMHGTKDISYLKESKCYLDDNVVWCAYSIFEENARPNIEESRLEHGNDKTYVGLFHGPLVNAITDIGYRFEHGSELSNFEGCDMVLLGDIHKRQHFSYGDTLMAYSGSLIQQNFGEKINEHGFLIWDVEQRNFIGYDISNSTPFCHFKINSLTDIENNTEILVN